MKKLFTVLMTSVIVAGLVACGESEGAQEETASNETDTEETTEDDDASEDDASEEEEEAADRPDSITMGFVPSTDSDQIAATVEPLAERLSEELGIEVEGTVMTNYSALVEAMGSGQVEVGFIPAFAYVLASERHDIEVILKSIRNGEDSYRAQYSVRADSGIESLEDLEGKVWAFPDVASTSGYLFPATQLRTELGVDEDDFFADLLEAGSHDNALITVLVGNADVATTFEDARDVIADDYPEVFDEETGLIQLGFTEPIPNDTISVIPGLGSFKDEIQQAFLSFNDNEEMIEIMQEVYRWDGIAEAADEDYDIVREAYELFSDEVDPLN
ncbi:phosphate/phosphite/phosphonate ABC transporter substrate-binding protein [Alteribacter keqinensis]|uniref:Phosphate/phosphite/phosphonate ABC transporter substrate-binding protein n=1 Tax=Alteribacter keqinensis TaxID=2483800 RepID=A0A3M7TX23_9BACI|nr:phosphate/phosphite/phosphonate ABC transporter substrate-binding protein [Alteribacter keqinensis]RNA70158.1 phosphate/phosphite/phosphonate ABC transporter substrate-binding protein [Alteribacter keqinensis]